MKILKRLFMSALAFVFALGLSAAFAACGTDESDTETSETDRIVGNWYCEETSRLGTAFNHMLITIEYDRFSFTEYRFKFYNKYYVRDIPYPWQSTEESNVYALEKRTKFDFVLYINEETAFDSFTVQKNVQLNVEKGEDPFICLKMQWLSDNASSGAVLKFTKTDLTIEEFNQMKVSDDIDFDTDQNSLGEFDTDRLQVEEGSFRRVN